jgi:lysozyme family protein
MALCYKGMEPESVAKMLRLTLEELEAIYNRSFWNKLEEKIIALFKSDTT